MQTLGDYRVEGQKRDAAIIALIQRHGVITSDLVQLAIAHERFDLPGESRAVVLNRLTALAGRGYFHRLGRSRSGHVVYATHKRRKGVQPQLEHDLIGSRFGIHLDLALADRDMSIADLLSDQAELRLLARKEEWSLVPDRMFTLNDVRYFCEFDNDTEGDDKIRQKIEAYKSYVRRERQRKEMMEKLGEKVSGFIRVLWVTTNEKRAEKLTGLMDGNLCWMTYEGVYLGNPGAILAATCRMGRIGNTRKIEKSGHDSSLSFVR